MNKDDKIICKEYKGEKMQNLQNTFDDFNLHARIIPALITTLPIYIYLLLKNLMTDNFIQSFLPNSVTYILLVALFYRIVRNLGKQYENKMYKELGAKPRRSFNLLF